MIFLCRLSEYEDWNVLLLEAGGHEPDLSDVPAFSSVLKGSNIDRQYVSQNENVSCGGKPCPVPRGIVLGGISTINAMLYVRGSPEGYDHWAELGNFLLKGKVVCLFVCLFLARQPPVDQALLIHEVSGSHTTTRQSWYNPSRRVTSSSQRPLPDKTQQSKQTNVHDPGGIRKHNLSRRATP